MQIKESKGGGQPHVQGAVANVPCDPVEKTVPTFPRSWHDSDTITVELKNGSNDTCKPYWSGTVGPTMMLQALQ